VNFEFQYKTYMKENNILITSDSDILDYDLTAKILNVKKLKKENLKSNRIISNKSSSINSNKSLFKVINNPSPRDNDPEINKNNSDQIYYQANKSNFINNNILNPNYNLNSNASLLNAPSISKINNDFKDYKSLFGNNQNPKILLIDDQKFIRKSLANILYLILKEKILMWDIIEGGDGIDLLNYIIEDNKNNNIIKLIITDENMEFINGTKAIELIRYLENENKIIKNNNIVITSSAEENEELNKYYKGIGANDILAKPCTQENLLIILEKLKIF